MKSKKALMWGVILSIIGLLGIVYNFLFGFEFSGRVIAFSIGFFFGLSLGLGLVLTFYNIFSSKTR